MVSAVLASRNEPVWGDAKVYVRKYRNTTTTVVAAAAASASHYSKTNDISLNYNNHIFKTKPNPNPNKQTRAHDPTNKVHFKQSPLPAAPGGSAASNEISLSGHLTFNIGAFTIRELKSLKKLLLSDLERVRTLRARIENSNFQAMPVYSTAHPLSFPNEPTRVRKRQNKVSGYKRANPFSNPKEKRVAKDPSAKNVMRRCGEIVTKLMKDRQGWVFNTPVDAVSLRLHDYRDIIKKPMDLGTVKSNLKNSVYKSEQDFAEDVRLTFNNALRYNPKGHSVYVMAETLLAKFEEMFEKLSHQQEILVKEGAALVKQKGRVMSLEEKIVLGRRLAELPQEEIDELWGIIKKRDGGISVDGDEIGLDIEALNDDNMLWELDRFVSNSSKKAMGKIQSKTEKEPVYNQVAISAVEEEEVDIGDEIPVENYPPVVIERDVDVSVNSSGSSSSGTDSSSSSGSGSSSDDDTAQSPFIGQKDAPMTLEI